MKIKLTFIVLFIIFVNGCKSIPENRIAIPSNKYEKDSQPILFLADPQIHNIYGVGVKQMSTGADFFSKVAMRPPELNILAPLVLQEIIKTSQKEHNDKKQIITVLGDTTNIACSGEFELFLESLKVIKPETIVLLAHGNHDTYLMGTVNSYIPSDTSSGWKVTEMENSEFPVDKHWWGDIKPPSLYGQKNWKDGCYSPKLANKEKDKDNFPMNKSRWIAKYIDHLNESGLDKNVKNVLQTNKDKKAYTFEYSTKPDTPLSKINYQIKGYWEPPRFGSKPSSSNFQRVSNSFVVQSADFIETNQRLILIDTSVCEQARGGVNFLATNAGENACIGDTQFEIIEQMIFSKPTDMNIIIGGHFPLEDLKRKERERLINLFSSQGQWTYISGHTHLPISTYQWNNGTEVNIGSTTDWPMEAHRISFYKNTSVINSIQSFYNSKPMQLTYIPRMIDSSSELCRHLPAARALANIELPLISGKWVSPPEKFKECILDNDSKWKNLGEKLNGYIVKINERFKDVDEKEYRLLMIAIAASASKLENSSFQFLDYIP